MTRTALRLLAATTLVATAACSLDSTAPGDDLTLGSAFLTAPAGMDALSSSFASDDSGQPWGGPMRGGRGGPMGGGPGMGNMMGGGLHDAYMAGAPGRGAQRGPFGMERFNGNCAPSGTTVTCTSTRGSLTVTSVHTITAADGTPQTAIDPNTTNTIRTVTTVTGSTTRSRDGSVTATVNNTSDRTVTGLAAGSTQRTVNGTARGSEIATGTNRQGEAFTSERLAEDITTNLVIPVSTTAQTFPTSGSVSRSMKVTITVTGKTPVTRERREVLTYDGSTTAKLVITENGTTKNCTVALPRGRPNCS